MNKFVIRGFTLKEINTKGSSTAEGKLSDIEKGEVGRNKENSKKKDMWEDKMNIDLKKYILGWFNIKVKFK